MFGKGININQQTVDNAVWYWHTLPLFACHNWAMLRLSCVSYDSHNDDDLFFVWYWLGPSTPDFISDLIRDFFNVSFLSAGL